MAQAGRHEETQIRLIQELRMALLARQPLGRETLADAVGQQLLRRLGPLVAVAVRARLVLMPVAVLEALEALDLLARSAG